jgi:hypothetical protein
MTMLATLKGSRCSWDRQELEQGLTGSLAESTALFLAEFYSSSLAGTCLLRSCLHLISSGVSSIVIMANHSVH